jgi:hypothetical protein
MPMLWIDISPEDHQRRKGLAARKGQSLKGSVLHRTLGDAPAHNGLSDRDRGVDRLPWTEGQTGAASFPACPPAARIVQNRISPARCLESRMRVIPQAGTGPSSEERSSKMNDTRPIHLCATGDPSRCLKPPSTHASIGQPGRLQLCLLINLPPPAMERFEPDSLCVTGSWALRTGSQRSDTMGIGETVIMLALGLRLSIGSYCLNPLD